MNKKSITSKSKKPPHGQTKIIPQEQLEKSNSEDDVDKALDEALKETFPASDPIAVDADISLHGNIASKEKKK
ncbi:hypothetical protein Undi14_11980 [Undibacterium sp. 14-3-2]|uniref:hypothetical protein n=1 Tax=Undibacterium sp. 14-3-2 TaxID=2800129 RepID=UPI0019034989|nr:hypothetical protein [Undibacterium sp. 14-3-2]MBK1890752.1 hypothetical protein [Undibacterium sp. 14-3-2]